MIAGGLSGSTSTGAAGTMANAAAPALQYAVGQYFKGQQTEGSTAHIVAHTVLAAAVAAAGGNDALTAGLSAGGAEALAPVVSNWLYGKDAKDLTADEKATVSNIVSLGAAGLTAGAGGTGADVVSSSQLASSAVEDNWLTEEEKTKLAMFNKACGPVPSSGNLSCREARKIVGDDLARDHKLAESINILLASGNRLGSAAVTEEEADAWQHINWAVQFLCPNGQCNDPDNKALWQLSQKTPKYFDQFVAPVHPEDYLLGTGGLVKLGARGLAGYLLERTMFNKGVILPELASRYAISSTKNPKALEVVLGKFEPGINATSYEQVAQSRGATYFDMDNWNLVNKAVGGSKEEIWKINKAFLDQQVKAGKTFTFTVNPKLLDENTFTRWEYDYLINLKKSNPSIKINILN